MNDFALVLHLKNGGSFFPSVVECKTFITYPNRAKIREGKTTFCFPRQGFLLFLFSTNFSSARRTLKKRPVNRLTFLLGDTIERPLCHVNTNLWNILWNIWLLIGQPKLRDTSLEILGKFKFSVKFEVIIKETIRASRIINPLIIYSENWQKNWLKN